jgi:UDP-glucose 4-epimerase
MSDQSNPTQYPATTMKRVCITGGAGFVGSNLADRLSSRGVEVVIIDNFRTGRREFVADALASGKVRLIEGDVLDMLALEEAVAGCDWVFHLQANADVRRGFEHPRRDLEQNTIATANVLEAMRSQGVSQIAFSSTGAMYGEPNVFPTPEDVAYPIQNSLYGASKVAGEGMIAAYAAGYDFTGVIFRYAAILGERYTHGHLFDFYCGLKRDPTRLRVLGDGNQNKSFLYIQDCIDAMLVVAERHRGEAGAFTYNLGTDETVLIRESARTVAEHLSLQPDFEFAGGRGGWRGDSPLIYLDTARIRSLGWAPKLTIREGVLRTVEWLDANEYAWRDEVARGAVATESALLNL